MNIQDIAALVSIRNYAYSVREDRHVFKGEAYHNVTAQIKRIDSFLAKVITEEDLVGLTLENMFPVKDEPKKQTKPKAKPKASKFKVSKVEEKSDKQMDLFDKSEDLSDDEAEALLAKRIAEEKEKLKKGT